MIKIELPAAGNQKVKVLLPDGTDVAERLCINTITISAQAGEATRAILECFCESATVEALGLDVIRIVGEQQPEPTAQPDAAPESGATFRCPRVDEATLPGQIELGSKAFWRRAGRQGQCSYCGSMSEEDFFEAIEDKATLGPTDKDYKVYVTLKGDLPGRQRKFYFQHMSPEGQERFVGMLNRSELQIGTPGHFYVLPFFCAWVGVPAATAE